MGSPAVSASFIGWAQKPDQLALIGRAFGRVGVFIAHHFLRDETLDEWTTISQGYLAQRYSFSRQACNECIGRMRNAGLLDTERDRPKGGIEGVGRVRVNSGPLRAFLNSVPESWADFLARSLAAKRRQMRDRVAFFLMKSRCQPDRHNPKNTDLTLLPSVPRPAAPPVRTHDPGGLAGAAAGVRPSTPRLPSASPFAA